MDFSFEEIKFDPKAIYIKRKHFKDINPKLLNPENVLTTNITQQQIKKTLNQEPRFAALFNPTTPKASSLNYLFNSLTNNKINIIQEKIRKNKVESELYFKLL